MKRSTGGIFWPPTLETVFDSDSSTRVSTPNSEAARSRPWLASELKPRSFRPPMSVTRQTRMSEPARASVVVAAPVSAASSSSPPQPAAATERTATASSAASHSSLLFVLTSPPPLPLVRARFGRMILNRSAALGLVRARDALEVGFGDEHTAGLRALVAGDDPAPLQHVDQAPGTGVADAQATLEQRHRGGLRLDDDLDRAVEQRVLVRVELLVAPLVLLRLGRVQER